MIITMIIYNNCNNIDNTNFDTDNYIISALFAPKKKLSVRPRFSPDANLRLVKNFNLLKK